MSTIIYRAYVRVNAHNPAVINKGMSTKRRVKCMPDEFIPEIKRMKLQDKIEMVKKYANKFNSL